jgi:hypothetical protein
MKPIVYETCENCGHDYPNECTLCPECSDIETPEIEKLIASGKWGDFRMGDFDVEYRDHLHLTPLMMAAYGDIQGVQLLLGWGAKVNAVDVYGWNACMHALSNGCYDIALELLASGADPFHKCRTGKGYLDVVYHEEKIQEVGEMIKHFQEKVASVAVMDLELGS